MFDNGYLLSENIFEYSKELGLALENISIQNFLEKAPSFKLENDYAKFDRRNHVPYLSEKHKSIFEASIEGGVILISKVAKLSERSIEHGYFANKLDLFMEEIEEDTSRKPADGAYLYVLGEDGRFYLISKRLDGKPFCHSSIYGYTPIKAAGELEAKKGKITYINSDSGHYKPSRRSPLLLLNFLVLSGYIYDEYEAVMGKTSRDFPRVLAH